MQCPECDSSHIPKNGKNKGKQNHICVNCDRQFIDHYNPPKGYSEHVKRECLSLYINSLDFRAIERVKGVHHTTVIYWVKQVGALLLDIDLLQRVCTVSVHTMEIIQQMPDTVEHQSSN